jgi:hypothetical protein
MRRLPLVTPSKCKCPVMGHFFWLEFLNSTLNLKFKKFKNP